MAALFPATTAYIERLPNGQDSHPDCRVKASLYRSTLEGRAIPRAAIDALPPRLQTLVVSPAPVTAWIPEVQSLALLNVHHLAP